MKSCKASPQEKRKVKKYTFRLHHVIFICMLTTCYLPILSLDKRMLITITTQKIIMEVIV